ncbi:hypothetical protein BB560_004555 [Smittium megazygosporum]|uniref:pyridoxal kinase n=1 Tax=Smittium megazygosporum TaxID=133381 RepID=A0A2T9Z915_9FUNG|nr:hypothetical protein BB560_004555 [Smittium megazygosporum]
MTKRVLSIQSHVVSGYVGNRAATFPMQYCGLDVDVINTVQLSNHTGYKSIKGSVFEGSHITDLFSGLETNGLTDYDYVLSGYMGNSDNVQAVSEIVRSLKNKNKNTFFLLDTVLGDYGELYVPVELVDLYRVHLCPLADMVTPNQFEAETLSGKKIKNINDAVEICDFFHSLGVKIVVITSFSLPDEHPDTLLHLVASIKSGGKSQVLKVSFPFLRGYFTGAGDLLCALLLSRLSELPSITDVSADDFKAAIESALASQHLILSATAEQQKLANIPAPPGLAQSQMSSELVRSFELRLIANRHLLVNPKIPFTSEFI